MPNARSFGRLAFVCLACSGMLAAAGCGGTNTTAPVVSPSTVPGSASSQVSPAGAVSASFTTSGGGSGTVGFPASTSGTAAVQIAITSTPPSGVPTLAASALARRPQSTTSAGILYASITFASAVTLPSLPAFSFGNQTIASSTQYYLAFYDPKAGSYQAPAEGPAAVAGGTIAFSAPATPYSFAAGTTYVFALYSQALSQIVASPNTLSFSALGASAAQTFSASETGYTGTFSATSANPAVATVAPGSTAGSFVVTPVGGGTTTVTLTDTNAQTATVNVSVTTGTFIPQ